jgi:hypothetical protein
MLRNLKQVSALLLVTALAACGGGGSASSNEVYGAIAIDTGRLESGIAAGYKTQDEADLMAKQNCGFPTCTVVHRYTGPGVCAVTAWSVGGVVSYGLAPTKADAEVNAIRNCTNAGGRYCQLAKFLCI